jgi:hypothetical protein
MQPYDTDRQNPTPSPDQLASIYPTPKTYDEMLKRRQMLDLSKPKINLHHLTASIAIRTYALLVLLAIIIVILVPKVMSLGVISGVFFSFFLALVWLGAVWWQLSAVTKPFYFIGLSLPVFILTYGTVAAPLTYGLLSLAPYVHSVLIVCLLATTAHFSLCYAIMRILTRNSKQE